jgi:tRNA modification GTPase
MAKASPDDTIIAVSTPPGPGGIGVIRLSGNRATAVARKLFRGRRASREFVPGRVSFGFLCDPENGRPFDEALLTYFRAPHSYTREDVIEISCHGSPAVLDEAIRLGLRHGARLAEPGEFTRRAYLRGRIDILQAEAVDDLVKARSIDVARLAFRSVEGRLSALAGGLRTEALRLVSGIEAMIEFPDEEIRFSRRKILSSIDKMAARLEKLSRSHETGRLIAEGITLAIIGRPNVGKSTLFNAFLEEARAIVTPFPGTTRDFLREKVRIGGTAFNLVDMAGFANPASPVEKEGMKRGRKIASQADGLLLVVDGTGNDWDDDLELLGPCKNKHKIIVINKIDACRGGRVPARLKERLAGFRAVAISALRGTNMDTLKSAVQEEFVPKTDRSVEVLLHLRDKLLVDEALRHLENAREGLETGQPEELYVEEIRAMIEVIGRLTGDIRADEVLDGIFSRFCVGK